MAPHSTLRTVASVSLVVASLLQASCGQSTDGPTPSQAIETELATGMENLQAALRTQATDDLLTSATAFDRAASLSATDPSATEGQKNKAFFFGGLARLVLVANPYGAAGSAPSAASAALSRLGELLDAYGMGGSRAQRSLIDEAHVNAWFTDCTSGPCQLRTLPSSAPSTATVQAFLSGPLADALREAANRLGAVTPSFQVTVTSSGSRVWFDYTDARFLKGVAEAAIATIRVQEAYDLDVDAVAAQAHGPWTYEQFREGHPTFLSLKSQPSSLALARSHAAAAAQSFKDALAALELETGDQADHFIKIGERTCTWSGYPSYTYTCTTVYNPPAKVAEIEDYLNGVAAAIGASGQYQFSVRGTTATFVPDNFFAGRSIRDLLPASVYVGAPMPDPTMGGVLVSPLLETWPR